MTEDLIPSPELVARFLFECSTQDVGLKATAGLHHPLRDRYRLTYEPDSPTGCMHGFINLFVATCLAFDRQLTNIEQISDVLNCQSIDEFRLEESGIGYRNLSIDAERVSQIRKSKMISFGSCSFDEPTGELDSLIRLNLQP